jgi:eukaryotic-like serine/threonine-protein kinase
MGCKRVSRKRQTRIDIEQPATVVLDNSVELPDVEFELDAPEFTENDIVGRYRLQYELGSGGMGVVVQARDELLQRDVAVKLIRRKFLDQPNIHKRFVNEALLTSRLQHPCIVPVYDLGKMDDHRPFFVMKLISGRSLASILETTPSDQHDRSQLLKIYEQVCQSIAYSHSQRILHLDIKPANIMIGAFGEVHVMDWGLAREFEPLISNCPTQNGNGHAAPCAGKEGEFEAFEVGGTPAYMSPEHARGESVDPSADIFGLGALLCEILTGRPPYNGDDLKRVHAHAMSGELDDAYRGLDKCNRDSRLVEIAKQCLAPKSCDRPQSVADVAAVIRKYLQSALEQAESDICRFFDLTLDLFCIASLEGYFRRLNVNFGKVLGYSEQKLISQPFLDFVHPDDVAGTVDVMQDLLEGKPVVQFCNRYRHADGRYIMLEWTAQAIPNEGNIFAVARDITNRVNTHDPDLD